MVRFVLIEHGKVVLAGNSGVGCEDLGEFSVRWYVLWRGVQGKNAVNKLGSRYNRYVFVLPKQGEVGLVRSLGLIVEI